MSFQSLLLQTNSREQVEKRIPFDRRHNNPDLIEINQDQSGITVEMIRQLQATLLEKPFYESHKLIIIYAAEVMNIVTQNALLKSLEEPPSHIRFLLQTTNLTELLPTIQSRCRIEIVESTEEVTDLGVEWDQLKKYTPHQIMEAMDSFKDRQVALATIRHWIDQAKSELTTQPTLELTSNLQHLQQAYVMLQANTNVKLVMEWVGLKIGKTS